MIFVSVGTNEARFDRLLRAIDDLDLDEELVIQHGHSNAPLRPGIDAVDFLSFEQMTATIRRSRAVVTHAGVGSILVALANGRRPIVVPRRKTFGEAVDDHQLQLGRRFASAGLVTLVEAPSDLGVALGTERHDATITPSAAALSSDLALFLTEAVPRPQATARG